MKKPSLFRAFMKHLQMRWKTEFPSIRPISEARGHLKKAHTFYAGLMRNTGQHVFFNFQHSNKAWSVGQFTINVVLASDEQNPRMCPGTKSDGHLAEGYYRIGHLLGRKDKWWHLQQDDDSILTEAWRPSSYENLDLVLAEAADDVTRDVLSTMKLLGVEIGQSSQTS